MQITFVHNMDAGFAAPVEVPQGTTIEGLIRQQLPRHDPSRFNIRLDYNPLPANALTGRPNLQYVLHEGQRVSVTPTKIEGAV